MNAKTWNCTLRFEHATAPADSSSDTSGDNRIRSSFLDRIKTDNPDCRYKCKNLRGDIAMQFDQSI